MGFFVDGAAVRRMSGLRVAYGVVFIVVGYSVYELLQHILPKGTFDINDIIGTVVGGLVALVLVLLLRVVLGERPAFTTEPEMPSHR